MAPTVECSLVRPSKWLWLRSAVFDGVEPTLLTSTQMPNRIDTTRSRRTAHGVALRGWLCVIAATGAGSLVLMGGRNLFRSGHRRQEATLRARVQDDWRATAGALQGAARSEQHRVSVHGGDVAVDEWKANESLCRYIARPAPANERVQTHAAGQLVLRIKTVWRDGTTHLVIAAAARPTERRLRRSPTRSFTWSGGVVAR